MCRRCHIYTLNYTDTSTWPEPLQFGKPTAKCRSFFVEASLWGKCSESFRHKHCFQPNRYQECWTKSTITSLEGGKDSKTYIDIGIMLYLSIQASRARKGIDEKSGEIMWDCPIECGIFSSLQWHPQEDLAASVPNSFWPWSQPSRDVSCPKVLQVLGNLSQIICSVHLTLWTESSYSSFKSEVNKPQLHTATSCYVSLSFFLRNEQKEGAWPAA